MSAREPQPLTTLLLTFAGCLTLLALNIGMAFLPVGRWHAPLAVLFALGEATLLGIWWMELGRRGALLRLAALLPLAWLLMMIVALALDDATRLQLPPLP